MNEKAYKMLDFGLTLFDGSVRDRKGIPTHWNSEDLAEYRQVCSYLDESNGWAIPASALQKAKEKGNFSAPGFVEEMARLAGIDENQVLKMRKYAEVAHLIGPTYTRGTTKAFISAYDMTEHFMPLLYNVCFFGGTVSDPKADMSRLVSIKYFEDSDMVKLSYCGSPAELILKKNVLKKNDEDILCLFTFGDHRLEIFDTAAKDGGGRAEYQQARLGFLLGRYSDRFKNGAKLIDEFCRPLLEPYTNKITEKDKLVEINTLQKPILKGYKPFRVKQSGLNCGPDSLLISLGNLVNNFNLKEFVSKFSSEAEGYEKSSNAIEELADYEGTARKLADVNMNVDVSVEKLLKIAEKIYKIYPQFSKKKVQAELGGIVQEGGESDYLVVGGVAGNPFSEDIYLFTVDISKYGGKIPPGVSELTGRFLSIIHHEDREKTDNLFQHFYGINKYGHAIDPLSEEVVPLPKLENGTIYIFVPKKAIGLNRALTKQDLEKWFSGSADDRRDVEETVFGEHLGKVYLPEDKIYQDLLETYCFMFDDYKKNKIYDNLPNIPKGIFDSTILFTSDSSNADPTIRAMIHATDLSLRWPFKIREISELISNFSVTASELERGLDYLRDYVSKISSLNELEDYTGFDVEEVVARASRLHPFLLELLGSRQELGIALTLQEIGRVVERTNLLDAMRKAGSTWKPDDRLKIIQGVARDSYTDISEPFKTYVLYNAYTLSLDILASYNNPLTMQSVKDSIENLNPTVGEGGEPYVVKLKAMLPEEKVRLARPQPIVDSTTAKDEFLSVFRKHDCLEGYVGELKSYFAKLSPSEKISFATIGEIVRVAVAEIDRYKDNNAIRELRGLCRKYNIQAVI